MAIIGLVLICLFILIYAFLVMALIKILRTKLLGVPAKAILALIIFAIIISPLFIVINIRNTPTALPINDVINITDESQELLIDSIEMPAPTYISGKGILTKFYNSIVTIHVTNNSGQQVFLGLQAYADSGTLGFYSPGSCYSSQVIAFDPNWAGDLQYTIKHTKFVYGGKVKLTFVKCDKFYTDFLIDLPGTKLFEKTYILVPEE